MFLKWMTKNNNHSIIYPTIISLLLILLLLALRLWLMAELPLTDTTEARYGELARVTATGNFWLMPHMTPTEPFFAKPPLSTWLAASSWLWLGHNELALRLPSLLMTILTCLALFYGAASFGLSRKQVVVTTLIILTTPVAFISAGAVMTDATQLTVITWAMVFSWRIFNNAGGNIDRIGFWTVIGLAALAKGLATWVLIGVPIFLYLLLLPKNESAWGQIKKIIYLPGILLATAIVLAWYVPAEIGYPGFLKYFIVGEHFQRFLVPGWQGDRYGHAHRVMIGMIWLYWVSSIFIWSPLFFRMAWLNKGGLNKQLSQQDRWLWAWTLAPLLFFTFSRNIIWTYTITAIPAFALLITRSLPLLSPQWKRITGWLLGLWIATIFISSSLWLPSLVELYSTRLIVATASKQMPNLPIYIKGRQEFSASYYSEGIIHAIDNTDVALEKVLVGPPALIIVTKELGNQLNQSRRGELIAVTGKHALIKTTLTSASNSQN